MPTVTRPLLRTFAAQIVDSRNQQRTVTVWARGVEHAREQLQALGYRRVLWVI